MTSNPLEDWELRFPDKDAAAAGTEGPFYELAGDVLFPEVLEVLAKPIGSDGPYLTVRLEIDFDAGKVICTSLEIKRAPGGEPIEQSIVSGLKVKSLLDAARVWQSANARAMVDIKGGVRGEDGQYVFRRDDTHGTERSALALGRQRKVTDELLREVAEVYQSDTLGAPTLAVEDHFDKPNRTATRWVKLARQRGFLPPYERPTKEN